MNTMTPLNMDMLFTIAGIFLGWTSLLLGVIGWFARRAVSSLDDKLRGMREQHELADAELNAKLGAVSDAQSREVEEWRRLERDLWQLRAEMPHQYVRREDYIRGQSVIEARLDAIASKLELTRIEGAKHGS